MTLSFLLSSVLVQTVNLPHCSAIIYTHIWWEHDEHILYSQNNEGVNDQMSCDPKTSHYCGWQHDITTALSKILPILI